LRSDLVEIGTRMLIEEVSAGLGTPEPQRGEPVYAEKIRPDELRIDWTKPAVEVDRLVRLGGAWTMLHGRRLKIVEAEVVDPAASGSNELIGDRVGGLRLVMVQPEGRAVLTFDAFRRGARLAPVEHLPA
jgi:methionyl-tRNA formyltransferase